MPGSRPALAGRDDSYRPMLKGATKSVWPPGIAGYDITGAQDTCFEPSEPLAGTADPQTPFLAAGAALLRLFVADGARQLGVARIRRRARRGRCRIQPPGLCARRGDPDAASGGGEGRAGAGLSRLHVSKRARRAAEF